MAKRSRYFKSGMFVLGSILVLIIFILLLGARNLFEKRFIIETYFDESVHGLDVGSAVKYRGVSIGNVKEIKFVQDIYPIEITDPNYSKGRYVLIRMSLRNVFNFKTDDPRDFIKNLSEQGLRVKITSQGLTGTSYLEIDYVSPQLNPPMDISWNPTNLYIPSTKSTFTKIGASLDELIQKIDDAEIDKFVNNVNKLVVTLDTAINDAKVGDLSKNTVGLLAEIRQTNQEMKKILASPGMQNLPSRMEESLANMSKSMTKLNNILSSNQNEITVTVENLRAASEDLREASGNAKKYPSYFLFGDAPNTSLKNK